MNESRYAGFGSNRIWPGSEPTGDAPALLPNRLASDKQQTSFQELIDAASPRAHGLYDFATRFTESRSR